MAPITGQFLHRNCTLFLDHDPSPEGSMNRKNRQELAELIIPPISDSLEVRYGAGAKALDVPFLPLDSITSYQVFG